MARQQRHRGQAPGDEELFDARHLAAMRSAAIDLCWLLDRGYAARSALEIVGNRHSLTARQRMAVSRSVCSIDDAKLRAGLQKEPAQMNGKELWIDAYNVLTVLETALAGGIVIVGRDGCFRDIAGIHRRYRKVTETVPALKLVADVCAEIGVSRCRWWIDKPVSNSGRLKKTILELATGTGWKADAELSFSPDHVLANTDHVIATSDGAVLDRCRGWVNLVDLAIASYVPNARLLELVIGEEEVE